MLILAFSSLSACKVFEEPEFENMGGIQIEEVKDSEIKFAINANISNPNWYAIKVKPSAVKIYLEDFFMGTVYLDEMVKLRKNRSNEINATFRADLADGAMVKALQYSTAETIKLRIEGKVKAGVFLFLKSLPSMRQRLFLENHSAYLDF